MNTGNLISVPLPFLNWACTSGNSLLIYYWSLAWRILNITLIACEMNAIVWQFEHFQHCPYLNLEWILTFSNPVATAEFSKFPDILSAALLYRRDLTNLPWGLCALAFSSLKCGHWKSFLFFLLTWSALKSNILFPATLMAGNLMILLKLLHIISSLPTVQPHQISCFHCVSLPP